MKDCLRLAAVQENPIVGDFAHNFGMMRDALARHADKDLVILSECFAIGYPMQDLALRRTFPARILTQYIPEISRLVQEAAGPALLVGALFPSAGKPFNAALLFERNGAIRVVAKSELPNDDVFDEIRQFSSNQSGRRRPLSFRGFELGIEICEDMWHGPVSRDLADEGADVLLVLNGSPYETGKQTIRVRHARRRVDANRLPLVYVNQFGGQDEVVFDGGSFAMNGHGVVIAQKAFTRADIGLTLTRNPDGFCEIEVLDPLNAKDAYPGDDEADYLAAITAVTDYFDKNRIPLAFVGNSGGIDSAVTLTMLVDALGPERVVGVRLPSEYTSDDSNDLGDELVVRLGCAAEAISIQEQFAAARKATTPAAQRLAERLGRTTNLEAMEENQQPRIRGMDLMSLANALGGIVVATGNKSEMSVGYATLYGDMCGGYALLKDFYKTRVFALARWRNANRPAGLKGPHAPIPEGIVTRPPTAELKPGQTDAKSLGDYDALDLVLHTLIEEEDTAAEAGLRLTEAFPSDRLPAMILDLSPFNYARLIEGKIKANEFKRLQAPPGVKITARSFGKGRRYPITGSYDL